MKKERMWDAKDAEVKENRRGEEEERHNIIS